MRSANTGQAAWNNLAALSDELAEQAHVFVIDVVNFLDAEFANLFAAEKFASAITATAAGTTIRARAIWPAATVSAAMRPWRWC